MTQETLFKQPPKSPTPVAVKEPLGECCKPGCTQVATLRSPGGSVYCEQHGRCGGKTVESTALGIQVRVCGKSVEQFVYDEKRGIWCCTCVGG